MRALPFASGAYTIMPAEECSSTNRNDRLGQPLAARLTSEFAATNLIVCRREVTVSKTHSAEIRLLQVLAAIAAVAVVGVLAILPYRLYQRDIRHATVHAHRIASVVQTAISHAILEGEDTSDLINRFQGMADIEIRIREREGGADPTAAPGTSRLDGTELTYVAPPILDRDGHAWLAEMRFDLSPMKRESVRLIIDLVVAVILGSAVFSAVVFLIVRHSLLVPLRNVTKTIDALQPEAEPVHMPEFESREMSELADAVVKACRAHRASI